MPEERFSLREAERRTGIRRVTLRAWLEDAGLCVPTVARGSKVLVSLAEIRAAVALHAPTKKLAATLGHGAKESAPEACRAGTAQPTFSEADKYAAAPVLGAEAE